MRESDLEYALYVINNAHIRPFVKSNLIYNVFRKTLS